MFEIEELRHVLSLMGDTGRQIILLEKQKKKKFHAPSPHTREISRGWGKGERTANEYANQVDSTNRVIPNCWRESHTGTRD